LDFEGVEKELNVMNDHKHYLIDALTEIKEVQDKITNSQTKYFDQLLLTLVGTDTIPFFLIMNNGRHLRFIDIDEQLETEFLRIESIDRELRNVTVSLLRALDFEENDTNLIADVVSLEKTSSKRSINLDFISGVQLLSPDLLRRKIICEPKW